MVSVSLIQDFMDFSACSSSVCMHLKRMRKERDEEKMTTDNYCFIKLITVGELCVNNGDIMGIQLFI